MPITRYTPEQRREIAENIRTVKHLNERRKNLYNRIYKKGWLHISTLTIRLVYITFLIVAIFLGDTLSTQQNETIKSVNLDRQTYYSKTRGYNVSTLRFSTYNDTYMVYNGILNLENKDTVIIERNLFRKPIYYSKDNWDKKYELDISRMYYIIFFITAISFLFTGGINRKVRKYIIIISIIDIFALIAYFFT